MAEETWVAEAYSVPDGIDGWDVVETIKREQPVIRAHFAQHGIGCRHYGPLWNGRDQFYLDVPISITPARLIEIATACPVRIPEAWTDQYPVQYPPGPADLN